jgi:hypothetical protein
MTPRPSFVTPSPTQTMPLESGTITTSHGLRKFGNDKGVQESSGAKRSSLGLFTLSSTGMPYSVKSSVMTVVQDAPPLTDRMIRSGVFTAASMRRESEGDT